MSLISKLLSAPIALALSTSSHLRAQWVVANMRQSLGLPGPDAPAAGRQELKARLRSAMEVLFAGQADPALLAALNAAFPGLRRALVLDWSPQPDHDRYALLVNPEQVALVQIGRQQAGPGPAPVLELVALRTYLARRMTSDARRLVQAACELMGEGGETAGSSGQARVRT
jgi:hypothetical protein